MSFTYVLDIHVHHIHISGMTQLAEYQRSTKTTDAALAAKVGCDRSMIAKIRTGTATPSLPLAVAIAKETGVPVESMIAAPLALNSEPAE